MNEFRLTGRTYLLESHYTRYNMKFKKKFDQNSKKHFFWKIFFWYFILKANSILTRLVCIKQFFSEKPKSKSQSNFENFSVVLGILLPVALEPMKISKCNFDQKNCYGIPFRAVMHHFTVMSKTKNTKIGKKSFFCFLKIFQNFEKSRIAQRFI